MTRDDIIRMAREANWADWEITGMTKHLKQFAELVAAAKCKELAEELRKMPLNDTANSIAIWIENENRA